ncbi:MAG TPA: glycine cleavage system protein GcvH [Dehalococcoidia bacterium]
MASPSDLKYTKEHEWVRIDADIGTVGITDYAQNQLGDIVFVDLPMPRTQVGALQKFGEIESVKAVSELFSPVSGEVLERNETLADNPQWVNDDPYGDGWMIRVRLSATGEIDKLMSAEEYETFLQTADH